MTIGRVWPNDGGTILLEVHETASITGEATWDLCGGQATERARQILCRRRATSNRVRFAIVAVDVDRAAVTLGWSPACLRLCPSRSPPRRSVASRYVTTTAVPLAVTISIDPFWPTVS